VKFAATIPFTAMLVIFLSFSQAMATGEGPVLPEAEATEVPITLVLPVPKSDVVRPSPSPSVGSEPSTSATMFRDLPSINGRYSVGGTTVLPYLGAGFGSGYTSERDRSLQGGSSIQTDPGFRSLFGQNLTPNEFQMGIRIPF
jgi:hypothetical protein